MVVIAGDCATAQNAPAPAASEPRPVARRSVQLPPITVQGRRKPRRPPRPAAAAKPSPAIKPANGGPPVEQTTAGPVSGYRALTSTSATRTDTPIERIPQAVV